MILVATACSKSPPKQAGDADSAEFVAAMEQGGNGEASRAAIVVPKDLVPVAVAAPQKECAHDPDALPAMAGGPGPEANATCKNYEVSAKASKHLQLTAADRANGYEDKWCVTTTYVRRVAQGPWSDAVYLAYYEKNGGAWHLETAYSGHSCYN